MKFKYAYPPILLDVVKKVLVRQADNRDVWAYAMMHAALMNSAILGTRLKRKGKSEEGGIDARLPTAWGTPNEYFSVYDEAERDFVRYSCSAFSAQGGPLMQGKLQVFRSLVSYGMRSLKLHTERVNDTNMAVTTKWLTEKTIQGWSLHVKKQLVMKRSGGDATLPWTKITNINQAGPVAGVFPDNVYYFVAEEPIDVATVGLQSTSSMLGTCAHLVFEQAPAIFEGSGVERERAIKMTRSLPSVSVAAGVVAYEFVGRAECRGGRAGEVVCPPFLLGEKAVLLRPDVVYVTGEATAETEVKVLELKTVWRKGGFSPPVRFMTVLDVAQAAQAFAQAVGVAAAHGASRVDAMLVHAVVPYFANPRTISCFRARKTMGLDDAISELRCMLLMPMGNDQDDAHQTIQKYVCRDLKYIDADDGTLKTVEDASAFEGLARSGYFEMRLSAHAYNQRETIKAVEGGDLVKLFPTHVLDEDSLHKFFENKVGPKKFRASLDVQKKWIKRTGPQGNRGYSIDYEILFGVVQEHGIPLRSHETRYQNMSITTILTGAGMKRALDENFLIAARTATSAFNAVPRDGSQQYTSPLHVPFDGYRRALDTSSTPDVGLVLTPAALDGLEATVVNPTCSALTEYERAGSNLIATASSTADNDTMNRNLVNLGDLIMLGTDALDI